MFPPAPGRLSTTTGWFQLSFILWATTRPVMSMLLPGPIGITMRTGFVGNSAPCAAPMIATSASAQSRKAEVERRK
jgi:hypothetical protein